MKRRGKRQASSTRNRGVFDWDVAADDRLEVERELEAFRRVLRGWPSLRGGDA